MAKKPKPTPEQRAAQERVYKLRTLRQQSIEQAKRLNKNYEYFTGDAVTW